MIPKFRGLSIDEKSKGEWQYGHLIEDRGRAFIINEVVEANEQYITIGSWCPVNPATLGQSTGLRDKNGKEVFIGDIVKCTRGCLHEVLFRKRIRWHIHRRNAFHISKGIAKWVCVD
ncbi:YopX protein [Streptococcus pneumoniae]|nr:YopX protein [Streptococcus pneumoniae]